MTERSEDGRTAHNCARISRLSDGRIVIICDYVELGETDPEKMPLNLWFSFDEGESWSEPFVIPGAHGIVPDRLVELSSGRWLVSAEYITSDSGKFGVYLWYSDDKGKTWSDRVTVASDRRYDLCESSLVEVQPNFVVAFLRENSMMGYDCFKAISRDGGQSFNGVYNVPLPGCHRPTAGILHDGRMLITYRFLQGGKPGFGSWMQNTFGAIMSRESALKVERGEQDTRIFPIDFDRSPVSDTGYTGWVQFDDDEIYMVNYLVDDAKKAFIRGSSFRTEEFLL